MVLKALRVMIAVPRLLLLVGALTVGAASVAPAASGQSPDTVYVLPEIRVIGSTADLSNIPGSATLVPPIALEIWRSLDANDVLRRVPGISVREEEGLGLRPNIGMRGLNPTRSTKVLLLEDGVPVTFAPYGDNASYYHPPISRFERVEVVRGSGQIAFGPQTVGGVINYITPGVPAGTGGRLSLAGGDQGLLDVNGRASTHVGDVGALLMGSHRRSDGGRANTSTTLSDGMVKLTVPFDARNQLTLRGNAYRERSNVTYSGLREAEWAVDPRANPFQNDSMKLDRWGASATHALAFSRVSQLTTTAYTSDVDRHWWRQSSNSAQRPNDSSDPTCAGMVNLNTTCGNEGRLRAYRQYGVETRLRAAYGLAGLSSLLEAGVRWHMEEQDRRQVNGASPLAREGGPTTNVNSGLREDNLRHNTAWSGFVQNRLGLDPVTVSPGIRLEHVAYERSNELNGVSGSTSLTEVIPGVGLTYEARPGFLVFAGTHRGFAPPRTEDIIDNATGEVVELDAELSWNYEVGVRGDAGPLGLELTAFRMDFENQIIPASVAGGTGATLTNSGRTLHQGLEAGLNLDAGDLLGVAGPYIESSWTWLPTASFEGERFGFIATAPGDTPGKVYAAQNGAADRTQVDLDGRRLPYAPELTYLLAVGFERPDGFDVRLERVGVTEQFTDPVNTRVTVPDGQQGAMPAYGIWNVSASARLPRAGTRLFLSLRNVTDELYLVDRTRGMIPGAPRSLYMGVRQEM
jgi:Fe(3+) dicitrate transport protein